METVQLVLLAATYLMLVAIFCIAATRAASRLQSRRLARKAKAPPSPQPPLWRPDPARVRRILQELERGSAGERTR